MKRDDDFLLLIIFLFGIGIATAFSSEPEVNQSVLKAHILDSQEQLITAMNLGEPQCDAWRTSKDTTVRCMWNVNHKIPILSCDDGRLIPEAYRTNGNIQDYCATTLD